MSNEMTQVDIDQLKAELAERQARVPALRDEVKRTKEYGDLSENDEYVTWSALSRTRSSSARIQRRMRSGCSTGLISTTRRTRRTAPSDWLRPCAMMC